MRQEVKIHGLKVGCLLACVVATAVASAAVCKVTMRPAEHWWGVCNSFGTNMPFTVETRDFKADLFAWNYGGQPASLLLSDQGRVVWCSEQTRVSIDGGVIAMESDGADVTVEQGGANLREAYLYASARHFPPSGKMPDPLFFSAPQYNTWMELTYNQNEIGILAYAQSMLDNRLPPGVLMIDDTWQENYGVWDFNPRKFSDPKGMCDRLHAAGFKVMLWACPFVSADSPAYRRLLKDGGLVQSAENGEVPRGEGDPATVRWWNGKSAALDFTHPRAREWFAGELRRLVDEFGVDGFKLDAGDLCYYDGSNRYRYADGARLHDATARPQDAASRYAEIGLAFPLNEYRTVWGHAGEPLVLRLADKRHEWRDLRRLIPDMAAMGIAGYPFVCPDMIGGGQVSSFVPGAPGFEQELFVRSAQVHALCPMMQFSAAPWRVLDEEHLAAVKRAVDVRASFVPRFMDLARECAKTGEPMLRSLEYAFPGCGYEAVADQFMMGDFLLVAPQLERGGSGRVVRIPPGRWRADDGTEVAGPCETVVATPLERIPHFVAQRRVCLTGQFESAAMPK